MARSGLPLLALALVLAAGVGIYALLAEEPVGGLAGVVVAQETGSPIPEATLVLTRPGRSEREAASQMARTDRQGRFRFIALPAGDWQLDGYSSAHRLAAPVRVTIPESRLQQVVLEMPPAAAFLESLRTQSTYRPQERPVLVVRGFMPQTALPVTIYRLDVVALREGGRLSGLLYGGYSSLRSLALGNAAQEVTSFTRPIARRDPEGIFLQRISLPDLGPGSYLAVAELNGRRAATLYNVTDLALVAKSAGSRLLAYAADLHTGQPAAGVPVQALVGNRPPLTATTDAQGLAVLSDAHLDEGAFLLARRGGSQAFIHVYSGEGAAGSLVAYAYSDRPVYRPGDRVYLKGVLRRRQDGGYRVPAGISVQLSVSDPNGNLVIKRGLVTSRFGSYAADFRLRPEALTGSYTVTADLPGRQSATSWVTVASYRKPELNLSLRPLRPRYLIGDYARVAVDSSYYFGSPVAGARVSYTVYRSPYYAFPEATEQPLSPAFAGYWESEEGGDYGPGGEYLTEGQVTTDREGRVTIAVKTSGPEPTQEEPPEYDYQYTVEASISEASRAQVSADTSFLATRGDFVLRLEPDSYAAVPGRPVSLTVRALDYDGKPVAGVAAVLAAGRESWPDAQPQRERRWQGRATTNQAGVGKATFTPGEAGSWFLEAHARDRGGRPLVARSSLWVVRGNGDLGYRYSGMELTTDRRSYQVGDTARVVVNTRHPGVSALVTVEGLELVDYRVAVLPNRTTLLDVPVTARCRPNATISVSYVYEGELVAGSVPLRVEVAGQALRVKVTPERRSYQPGEQAVLVVHTATHSGQPTPAEVSVGVVDESIYGVRPDDTPHPFDYFWGRTPNWVQTHWSFAEVYLDDGDKEGAAALRRRFPDTAYWNPAVVTGPDGEARLSFTVPDTLTTWRITARGHDLESRFGQTRAAMLVTRPLLVRLAVPPVLRVGDRPVIAGIVHNRTRETLQVSTRLQVSGLRLTRGEPRARFSLPAGELRRIEWPALVYRTGLARMRFYASGGTLADAIELRPRLLHAGRETLAYRSGAVAGGQAGELVYLRADAVPSASAVTINLSPTLAGSLLAALPYLASYPYGCTEQVMSSFLPDVVLAREAPALGQAAALPASLPDMVADGLLKLYALRHADGGWGWWAYDQSDPWMTAYVLFGLGIAREAGFAVNPETASRAANWLQNRLTHGSDLPDSVQAFALYALASGHEAGPVQGVLAKLTGRAQVLDPAALAALALTHQALRHPAEAQQLAARLWARLIVEGGENLALWQAPLRVSYYTPLDATALALAAVVRITSDHPRLPAVIRWLMEQRTGDHWQSTRQTAWVIYALAPYLARELRPDETATVALNGEPVATQTFVPGDALQPDRVVDLPGSRLKRGANTINISRQGTGSVYYAITTRQTLRPRPGVLLTGTGIGMRKAYYRVRTARDPETGFAVARPASQPATSFRSGEPLLVRLTITTPVALSFVMIEDPYPAGMQAADLGQVAPWAWNRWWSGMDVRDDRVNIPARQVPVGTSTVEYYLRAVTPGRYRVAPTALYEMYRPQVQAYTAPSEVEVRP